MTAPPTSSGPYAATPTSGAVAVVGALVLRFDRRGHDTEVELVSHDGPADPPVVAAAAATVAELRTRPALAGSTFHLAAEHPVDALHPLAEAVADALGLTDRRDLLQLRRPLPVPADHPTRAAAPPLAIRPFRPGPDDLGWLRVNNRAFATHPDQGHETPQTLADRTAEPWFDATGFLVADDPIRPGELAGFCWTKVHPPTDADPELGEIYVIGVDPSHRGEGLGPTLTLAGLDHLGQRGIATAVLYVDADNAPARRLYDRLGFTAHTRRRVYAS